MAVALAVKITQCWHTLILHGLVGMGWPSLILTGAGKDSLGTCGWWGGQAISRESRALEEHMDGYISFMGDYKFALSIYPARARSF